MNKQFATALKLSALSLALLAAGCGGGGSSSNPDDGVAATRSVQGTAAKGIIKGGLVQVYALDAQGKKGATPVATGKTGNDGSFTVSIPKDVLLFVVEVSATAGAVMADEATGKDIAVPTNMVLRNVVTLDAGAGSYTGTVTPLTELAVKTAEKATGGLTATNVAQAKAGVRAMLGFDPETVKPINANSADAATATEEQKTQALMLAAISKMAQDGALGCAAADVTCVVNKVADSATLSGTTMTLGTTGATLETATKAVAVDTTINKTGKTTIELPAIKVPVTLPPVADTGVQATKAMIASLRTNLNTFANSGTALEARLDQVNVAFDTMVGPIDYKLVQWAMVPPAAINYFLDFKDSVETSLQPVLYVGESAAYCRLFSDVNFSIPATSKDDALNISCSIGAHDISYTYDQATGVSTRKSVTQILNISPTTGSAHDYNTLTRVETYVNGTRNKSLDVRLGHKVGGTITYTPRSSTSNYALDGKLPARTDGAGNKLSDYEVWHLATTRTNDATAKTSTYTIAADMKAFTGPVDAGTMVGKLIISDGLLRVSSEAAADNATTMESLGVKDLTMSITGAVAGSSIGGTVKLENWKADKNSRTYVPTNVEFAGEITEASKPFFSGSLKVALTGVSTYDSALPANDQNFLGQTVTLAGSMALPNRPALGVSVSVANATGDKRTVIGQYNDGTATINFNGSHTASNAASTSMKISSTAGVSFEFTQQDLDNGTQNLPVMLNSAKVAQINLKTGVITYTDNTFESLK